MLLLCLGVGAGSLAVHIGIAHWEIGMDGAAVSLENNGGINIKEQRLFRLFGEGREGNERRESYLRRKRIY